MKYIFLMFVLVTILELWRTWTLFKEVSIITIFILIISMLCFVFYNKQKQTR